MCVYIYVHSHTQVTLNYGYKYERSLSPTEKGRITSFSTMEDTNTSLSPSSITASMILSSRIQKGANVTISNLLGSSTLSDPQLSIVSLDCSELSPSRYLVCQASQYQVVSPTGTWNQRQGTLQVRMLVDVAPRTRVSFGFVLQNGQK